MFLVVSSVTTGRNRGKGNHEIAAMAKGWWLLLAALAAEMAPNTRDDLGEHWCRDKGFIGDSEPDAIRISLDYFYMCDRHGTVWVSI